MSNPSQDLPVPNPSGWPRFTQRLFSEEVGIAQAESEVDPLQKEPGYEFSNGRRFHSRPNSAGA